MNKIIHGDCLEKLKELEDNSIDSIVTDPPYELGFMGKSWDNTGIANNVDMWAECLRVLKPGGHLLAFSGTRTYHRMAVAIEDAGFEIRDMIEWVYGSGFPKSLNIGKSVNQLETNEWSKISKAFDNIDQKSIMELWKRDVLFATIKLSKSIIEVGTNTPKNFFVPDIAVLYHNPLNEQLSAIFAELKLSVLNHISEENEIIAQKNVGQITIPSLNLARYAVKLSQSLGVLSLSIFTAECDVKEWLNENTEVNHKVDEALKTLRGNKKYSNEEITSVVCAVLTNALKLTILNQSKTFQSLDITQKMECVSAINAIITEYTAENLISNTVAILKSKAVDKLQGNEREVSRVRTDGAGNGNSENVMYDADHKFVATKVFNETKGNSEWEGWGTALKPAHEPICMARKPLAGKTVAENCLKWGTGGINIDESRVETNEELNYGTGQKSNVGFKTSPQNNNRPVYDGLGRFPANLIHDNSEEVRECFPESKSPKTYIRKSSGYSTGNSGIKTIGEEAGKESLNFGDSGNASRFFKSIDFGEICRYCHSENEEKYVYCQVCGKRSERMQNLVDSVAGKSIIYQAKASKSERGQNNNHPTVKPIALMEYLIKMVTPKEGIVLDPFAGSGTTGVACKNINRNYILIEKEQEYIDIINKRLL